MLTPAEYTAKKKREQARERQRRFRERHPELRSHRKPPKQNREKNEEADA